MELVQDLVWTASVALILSFFVAKLVAMAMADRDSEPSEFKVGEGVVMEELRFEERLKVEEAFQSQRRVQFVGEVKAVDLFDGGPAQSVDEVVEPAQSVAEVVEPVQLSQLKEEKIVERGLGEESAAVGLPKEKSDGEEKLSVDKASDFDRGHEAQTNSETNVMVESASNDVVAAQARVGDCSELKGKSDADEVKLGNYSDEDDWEGIESSELDGYAAASAVKFEGR